MRNFVRLATLMAAAAAIAGCSYQTTHAPNRASPEQLAMEESVMFVRPDRYTILGTRSISDYVEITYERSHVNQAGQTVVELGLRNRGGQRWYDKKGPNVALSVKTTFYDAAVTADGPSGPPLYETNWQPVSVPRGDTAHYKAACPVSEGVHYQVLISELRR